MVQETRRSSGETAPEATAQEVAAWLAAHPEFLDDHPELIARLQPRGHTRPDGAVDLQSYRVERLSAEIDRLKEQQRALLGASRANQNSQYRVHAAILFLLDAESFEQLIQTVTTDLAVLLDLDVVCLMVESDGGQAAVVPGAHASGVKVVGEGFIEKAMKGRDILLEGNVDKEEAIWGPAAGLVRSHGLVRLNVSGDSPAAVLALGSREPDMFNSGMRTELMSFLARVVERCIRSWLDVAP
jgi:uncharacterized protein YigA (DUF484 family)